jgi:hypothetical protein
MPMGLMRVPQFRSPYISSEVLKTQNEGEGNVHMKRFCDVNALS